VQAWNAKRRYGFGFDGRAIGGVEDVLGHSEEGSGFMAGIAAIFKLIHHISSPLKR
jgi:hypothetical protein